MKSRQILVRGSAELHQHLVRTAQRSGQSLNDLCLDRLSTPAAHGSEVADAPRQVVQSAERLLGIDLVGVLFYGSRARGEESSNSDWDILVIPAASVPLSRQFYRQWDASTEALAPQIEVHFAHLPNSTRIATSLWSELALVAIVVYEQQYILSRYLAKVRHDIMAGRIVRKTVHGQAYWVHTEAA